MAKIQNVYIFRIENVFLHLSNNSLESDLLKNIDLIITKITKRVGL